MKIKQQIKKFNVDNIDAILNELKFDEDLLQKLRMLESDIAIFNHLKEAEPYEAAIKYLAFGLPKREAIWWAYICSEALEKDNDDPKTQEALAIAAAWVKDPTDGKRRRAGKLGEALEFYTPASWTVTAIFWSGGSITPEGRPEVPASDEMCAEAVSNAIIISAHKMPEDTHECFAKFLRKGLHIAMGGNGRID